VLFPAVTESPSREFIAAQLTAAKCAQLVVPFAGRFAVPLAAAPVIGPANIWAYDTTLMATLLGYLAAGMDPGELCLPEPAMYTGHPARNAYDFAAGVMIAIRLAATSRSSAYMAEQARAIRQVRVGLRSWLSGQVQSQAQALAGVHYTLAALRDTLSGVQGRRVRVPRTARAQGPAPQRARRRRSILLDAARGAVRRGARGGQLAALTQALWHPSCRCRHTR
jgi:hypothetical protein